MRSHDCFRQHRVTRLGSGRRLGLIIAGSACVGAAWGQGHSTYTPNLQLTIAPFAGVATTNTGTPGTSATETGALVLSKSSNNKFQEAATDVLTFYLWNNGTAVLTGPANNSVSFTFSTFSAIVNAKFASSGTNTLTVTSSAAAQAITVDVDIKNGQTYPGTGTSADGTYTGNITISVSVS